MRVTADLESSPKTAPALREGPWFLARYLSSNRSFVLGLAVFEVAFYFAYRYGMSFSHASASPFWFPDSVLLCALLLTPPRLWWVFLLAPLPIRLTVAVPPDTPLWFLIATFAIDSAKGVVAAAGLRLFSKNPIHFETVRDFSIFCLIAVLLVPAASAFGGAAARHALGQDYWTAWKEWFLGDALAQLVITPALLHWVYGAPRRMSSPDLGRLLEGAALAVCLLATSYLAFNAVPGSLLFAEAYFYAPVPFLFWAAIRFGMHGACGAVILVAALSIDAALGGHGPFSGMSAAGTALALQQFLLLRAVPAYVVAVVAEQTKRTERALRESEERFRHVADSAPVFMWMSGADGLRQFFNRGWLQFTGRAVEREAGTGWAESVHPEDRQHCFDVHRSAIEARSSFETEYRLRRRDGEYRWVVERGVPRYGPDGAFIGHIGSAIDVADRKWAEEAQRGLAHMQRLAMMGELTALIAHEVNQPLAAILTNAEAAKMLLESDAPPLDEIRDIVDDIRRDDLRADETLRRIRGLLRKREMQMQPLDLNEVVSDVLRLAAPDVSRRRVQIRTDLARGLPPAFGDRACLQQVTLNLVINGMDAMAAVHERARHLTVRTGRSADGDLEVAVTDNGAGLPPDGMQRVFESFFTTKTEGMGLGLPIARSIVDAHQGRIWAENDPGGGATFRFTVRAAARVVTEETAAHRQPMGASLDAEAAPAGDAGSASSADSRGEVLPVVSAPHGQGRHHQQRQ